MKRRQFLKTAAAAGLVPSEKVVLEDAKAGGDVTYYRDAQSVHHVPKRPLDEVLVKLGRE